MSIYSTDLLKLPFMYRPYFPIFILCLLSLQWVKSVQTATIPPTTTPPLGCRQNGNFYRAGEEISRGQTGDWCYGSSCSPTGTIVQWNDFNCGTSTTPLTTTARINGCLVSGKLYQPGETISQGKSGTWCHGTYCDLNSEVISWDNFNCGTTPITTISPTSTGPTTNPPTTIPPPTTVPTTPLLPGCFYNGQLYPPGQPITSEGNGCGIFCSTDSEILYATCTNPPTTIPPPTPVTTPPPPPGCFNNGQYYPPGQTITSDPDGCGVFCSMDGEVLYATCTRAPTTTPLTTHQTTPLQGCEYEGKIYPIGAQFGEGKSGSWCFGNTCSEGGQILAWDNFNCDPTTVPSTTAPPGCYYNGKVYPPGQPITSEANGCGILCGTDGEILYATCTNPPTTIPPPTTTTQPPGCFYKGQFYPPGQPITSEVNRCGVYCSRDGELLYATCTNPPTTIPPPTPVITTSPPPGCFYNGQYYPLGRTITSDSDGCGVFCSMEGDILYATCTRAPPTTPLTTRPTTRLQGCQYKGRIYPIGARFGEGKSGSWCFGMICSEGGQILNWDNFNCDSTTSVPSTSTPSETTSTGPSSISCLYKGQMYSPGEEISRVIGPNMCYGTLCDDNGDVIAWEDYTCGNSTDDAISQEPIKDCQYKGVSYKPGQKISLSDGRGCKVYCSLSGRVRIERFPCLQPVTQPNQNDEENSRTDWTPCIPEKDARPDTPLNGICVSGSWKITFNVYLTVTIITFGALLHSR